MLQIVASLTEVRWRQTVLLAEGAGKDLAAVEARGEGYLLNAVVSFCQQACGVTDAIGKKGCTYCRPLLSVVE